MTSESTQPQASNSSFSMDDFAQALEEHDYNFEKGKVVRGKVFQHSSDGAYIDIGGKSPGFVPFMEASAQQVTNLADFLPLQEEMEFLIISNQNAEGQVTLSRRQLELKQSWAKIAEIAESGKSVQMRVMGTNRGGVVGEVEGLRGFIPRSHLIEKEDLDSLIGQLLTATFLEVNPETNKLVLSQREIARAEAMGKLQPGILKEGKVVNIKPYGVFVDLDGVSALLHVTEISDNRVESLSDLFQIGQLIKVMIVSIDEYKNRIALSTKVLEKYPGEMLEKMAEVMENAEERVEMAQEKLASLASAS